MEPVQPRRRYPLRRRLLAGSAAVVLTVGLGSVAVAVHHAGGRDGPPAAPAASPEPHRRALPRAAQSRGPAMDTTSPTARHAAEGSRTEAVRELLEQRARAVRRGNRSAFLATVGSGDAEFRAAQRQLFRNLRRLPLAVWEYEIVSGTPAGDGKADTTVRSDPSEWTSKLVLRYRFAGFDDGTTTAARYLTFTHGPDGVQVTGVADRTTRRIWDLGALRVVETDRALVLGLGGSPIRLRALARRMERAVPAVSEVWGRDWARRSVVLVPATRHQASMLSPASKDLTGITAVATVASGPGGVPPAGTGDRIIVNPGSFSDLSPFGQRVVLRHELTHVATRSLTDSTVPVWLVEGFADYVGYRGAYRSPRSIARTTAEAMRSGRVPRTLPTREDFASDSARLARAYETAWLACEMIATRYGEQRLMLLYRTLGAHGVSESRTDARVRREAMQRVLGVTPERFTELLRSYMRAKLG